MPARARRCARRSLPRSAAYIPTPAFTHLVNPLALLGREHLAHAPHGLHAQQRELGHRLTLRVGKLARAGAVEALGGDQLAELQARAAQLLDLLVYRRAAVVENLEHLVLLRLAQAERAQ